MDLRRPDNESRAKFLLEKYAGDAPAILKEDFYNSLLAAYTPGEITDQLQLAGLGYLELTLPSDRHWMVTGSLAG